MHDLRHTKSTYEPLNFHRKFKRSMSYMFGAWSSLDKVEQLAWQITSPFNKKMGCFWKAIFLILFSIQPNVLLNGEVIGQAVTPLYLKS